MKLAQVAVQLYTLRKHCTTAAEYAVTLKRVREIGYQSIQISGVGPIPPGELRSIADGEGLTICATHEPALTILNDPQKVVERLQILGCKYTAYPFPSEVDFSEEEHIKKLIAGLNNAGAMLHAAGQVLCYHNHAHEFARHESGTILDRIYRETAPENLQGELDTYWVQAGGANPVEWCSKLKNRLPLLHLKDYAVDVKGVPQFAEIGYGNLDFKAIVASAEEAGCKHFIVEQDTCPVDEFDSIARSFEYIKAHLVS